MWCASCQCLTTARSANVRVDTPASCSNGWSLLVPCASATLCLRACRGGRARARFKRRRHPRCLAARSHPDNNTRGGLSRVPFSRSTVPFPPPPTPPPPPSPPYCVHLSPRVITSAKWHHDFAAPLRLLLLHPPPSPLCPFRLRRGATGPGYMRSTSPCFARPSSLRGRVLPASRRRHRLQMSWPG